VTGNPADQGACREREPRQIGRKTQIQTYRAPSSMAVPGDPLITCLDVSAAICFILEMNDIAERHKEL
jgi:hypothetical protein